MTVVGLQWVQSTDTYSCPAADSIGSLTPATRVAACNAIDPWMSMVRCNLWDTGVQTATGANSNTSAAADRCYTDTDVANMGQVMVKLKKFWYATNHTGSPGSMTYRWYISSTGADSLPSGVGAWKVHPAFTRNSVTKSQIYLGAYEGYYDGVSKLESVAGVTPSTGAGYTLSGFRGYAEARGTGWEQNDFLSLCAVQLLYLLEYGTFYQANVIGRGITNDSALHNTGETTSYGNTTYGTTANATTAMSYRGIENLYGNTLKIIDGINIQNYVPAIADHGFANDTYTGTYTSTSLTLGTMTSAGLADIITSSTYDYVFFPYNGGAPSVQVDLCALVSTATGNVGWQSGLGYGLQWGPSMFGGWMSYPETNYGPYTGSRLMYIG